MTIKVKNRQLSKSLSKLFQNPCTADVKFVIQTEDGKEEIPAHKCILAASSSVFDAMFYGLLKQNREIEIFDVCESAFREFLQFFYLPEVELRMENFEAVVRLADKYDILGHLNACAEFLMKPLIAQNKIISGYQLAITFKIPRLIEFCEDHIKTMSRADFETDDFLNCDKIVVQSILKLNSVRISEVNLFEVCVDWAKIACKKNDLPDDNPKNWRNQLGNCIQMIRYATMTLEDLSVILANDKFNAIFEHAEVADILCMKTIINYKTKIFDTITRAYERNREYCMKCNLLITREKGSTVFIRNRESTWFSANCHVLLGEILCTKFTRSLCFNITLFEHNDESFAMNIGSKILYSKIVECKVGPECTGPTISLPKPILVRPNRRYEIRSDAMGNVADVSHNSIWRRETKLDETITIQIHMVPADGHSNHRGTVDEIHFYKI